MVCCVCVVCVLCVCVCVLCVCCVCTCAWGEVNGLHNIKQVHTNTYTHTYTQHVSCSQFSHTHIPDVMNECVCVVCVCVGVCVCVCVLVNKYVWGGELIVVCALVCTNWLCDMCVCVVCVYMCMERGFGRMIHFMYL